MTSRSISPCPLLCRSALATASVLCTKQEKYKRTLIKGDVTPLIVRLLTDHARHPGIIAEAVGVMKIVTKDDDVAATQSKAFDNSREFVAAGALPAAMALLGIYKDDRAMVPVVFGAIKHLACDDKTCVVRVMR